MTFLAYFSVSQMGDIICIIVLNLRLKITFEESEKIIKSIPTKNVIVIELSAILKAKAKSLCSTFIDFAEEVYSSIMFSEKGYDRCDVVTDNYFAWFDNNGTIPVI